MTGFILWFNKKLLVRENCMDCRAIYILEENLLGGLHPDRGLMDSPRFSFEPFHSSITEYATLVPAAYRTRYGKIYCTLYIIHCTVKCTEQCTLYSSVCTVYVKCEMLHFITLLYVHCTLYSVRCCVLM